MHFGNDRTSSLCSWNSSGRVSIWSGCWKRACPEIGKYNLWRSTSNLTIGAAFFTSATSGSELKELDNSWRSWGDMIWLRGGADAWKTITFRSAIGCPQHHLLDCRHPDVHVVLHRHLGNGHAGLDWPIWHGWINYNFTTCMVQWKCMHICLVQTPPKLTW